MMNLKEYGNIILNLALEEARKLGFKRARINCDDNNAHYKKVIEKNCGIIDIKSYKTNDGLYYKFKLTVMQCQNLTSCFL